MLFQFQLRLGGGLSPGSSWFGAVRFTIGFRIHQVAQLLAGFEVGNTFRGHLYLGPGFGIAADSRLALPDSEAAEPAYFDFVA